MRKQLFGRLDYSKLRSSDSAESSDPPELILEATHGSVFVDGKEIKQAWYIDTEAGIVKTYDVIGDGKAWLVKEVTYTPADFPGREVECPPDGILSETLRGNVELYGPEQ